MIRSMAKEHHPRASTLWRPAVDSWLRRQGLISIRQIQLPICVLEFAAQRIIGRFGDADKFRIFLNHHIRNSDHRHGDSMLHIQS
jgi:hypothetical protein